jgi:excisionase family DNA binding protein
MHRHHPANSCENLATIDQVVMRFVRRREEELGVAVLRGRLTELTRELTLQLTLFGVLMYDGWLTQAQAAELTNLHRGTIGRAAKAGKIVSNGESGRACRLHGESVLEFYRTGERARLDFGPENSHR